MKIFLRNSSKHNKSEKIKKIKKGKHTLQEKWGTAGRSEHMQGARQGRGKVACGPRELVCAQSKGERWAVRKSLWDFPRNLKNLEIWYSFLGTIFCFELQSRPLVYSQSLSKVLLNATTLDYWSFSWKVKEEWQCPSKRWSGVGSRGEEARGTKSRAINNHENVSSDVPYLGIIPTILTSNLKCSGLELFSWMLKM